MSINVGTPRRRDPSTETVHRYTCPLCECMCGLDVHVDAEQKVSLIRGAKDDVWSKGYSCPKGSALGHLHHDPDRLRTPMIRDGETWREAGWDEAFARCEELIHPLLERDGIAAFTAFVGNPVGHSFSLGAVHGPPDRRLGNAAHLLGRHGRPVAEERHHLADVRQPVADPDRRHRAHRLLAAAWAEIRRPPAAVCSPIPTSSARWRRSARAAARSSSSTHAGPRPPTRPTSGWRSSPAPTQRGSWRSSTCCSPRDTSPSARSTAWSTASMRSVTPCAVFTPERVEAFTRVPAETTRRIANEIVAARAAAVYGRIGLCNQEFGTLASWLVDVLAICSRALRQARRADVRQSDHRPARLAGLDQGQRACRVRSVAFARSAASPRCSARCLRRAWPRRSPPPGRGQIKGLDHRRRQPGDHGARLGPARGRAADCSSA